MYWLDPAPDTIKWTLDEAIRLIKQIELFAPDYGCHVALTGGLLYKDGPRKDLDILFYRIRQKPKIDEEKLLEALKSLDIHIERTIGWVTKAKHNGKSIDLFFPERNTNEDLYHRDPNDSKSDR